MTDLNVKPGELRLSAQVADSVNSQTLHDQINQAVTGTDTAAASLRGWPIGPELEDLAGSWQRALNGLEGRMAAGADALRGCAATHEWNDTLAGRDFEGL